MSVRKREWTTATGEVKEAWQACFTDGAGKRRTKTFFYKKEADAYHATAHLLAHTRPRPVPTDSVVFNVDQICVYRHYDRDGVLLYVGLTTKLFARQSVHLAGGKWRNEIAKIAINRFADMGDALKAEFEAISTEMPKYNQTHKPRLPQTYNLPQTKEAMKLEREANVARRAAIAAEEVV
jgi:hypothetical protein